MNNVIPFPSPEQRRREPWKLPSGTYCPPLPPFAPHLADRQADKMWNIIGYVIAASITTWWLAWAIHAEWWR